MRLGSRDRYWSHRKQRRISFGRALEFCGKSSTSSVGREAERNNIDPRGEKVISLSILVSLRLLTLKGWHNKP